jgi:hypothetical protein
MQALKFCQGNRAGGLILSVDIVVARRGAHLAQLWRVSWELASLEERRASR